MLPADSTTADQKSSGWSFDFGGGGGGGGGSVSANPFASTPFAFDRGAAAAAAAAAPAIGGNASAAAAATDAVSRVRKGVAVKRSAASQSPLSSPSFAAPRTYGQRIDALTRVLTTSFYDTPHRRDDCPRTKAHRIVCRRAR
jgi:hypothetical protein